MGYEERYHYDRDYEERQRRYSEKAYQEAQRKREEEHKQRMAEYDRKEDEFYNEMLDRHCNDEEFEEYNEVADREFKEKINNIMNNISVHLGKKNGEDK
jgi:flagellar motor switch/type III secretory pathway protein FliN